VSIVRSEEQCQEADSTTGQGGGQTSGIRAKSRKSDVIAANADGRRLSKVRRQLQGCGVSCMQ
jgi:16S rRNA C967 or C1407 C5-methylase (RsmB/RsmF family)